MVCSRIADLALYNTIQVSRGSDHVQFQTMSKYPPNSLSNTHPRLSLPPHTAASSSRASKSMSPTAWLEASTASASTRQDRRSTLFLRGLGQLALPHPAVEEVVFSEIDRLRGEMGSMKVDVKQHYACRPSLERVREYATSTAPAQYDADMLRHILDDS